MAALGYEAERDTENPADSVSLQPRGRRNGPVGRGAPAHACGQRLAGGDAAAGGGGIAGAPAASHVLCRDTGAGQGTAGYLRADLWSGPPVFAPRPPARPRPQETAEKRPIREQNLGPEYLLVDGYNIIFAWDELKAVARENLDAARKQLCDLLCNYQGFRRCRVIVVFDAYKVKGNPGSVTRYHNIHVVYTKEAETADAYIEKATYEIGRHHRVRVATSDGPEQLIILGHGALRISASAFRDEVEQVQGQISRILENNRHRQPKAGALRAALERAQPERKKEETP